MSKDCYPAFHVLIPAAGSGTRTGLSLPKQYHTLEGKMILRHTLEKFVSIQGLKSIRVIIDPEHAALYEQAVLGLTLPPPVPGDKTRKQSVRNGLASLIEADDNDIVLIHDAARPFVTRSLIEAVLQAALRDQAATLATPIADTLVTRNYDPIARDHINAVQTPQAFRLGLLKQAHERHKDDERFTDDASLVAAMGLPVTMVPGTRGNFKITTSEDLHMAERILATARETRAGFGYDVHAFAPAPADSIRLGGIDIPHSRKLLGHSDADVILHALTDALLGTIGEGDIGQLFPPSDMTWKNADSEIFVKEALRRVHLKGGQIVHADITLIAEEPKIGPHRDKIKSRIATILNLDTSRIGLKATTSEGLGFTGRKEGIAAHAVVTITLPL